MQGECSKEKVFLIGVLGVKQYYSALKFKDLNSQNAVVLVAYRHLLNYVLTIISISVLASVICVYIQLI